MHYSGCIIIPWVKKNVIVMKLHTPKNMYPPTMLPVLSYLIGKGANQPAGSNIQAGFPCGYPTSFSQFLSLVTVVIAHLCIARRVTMFLLSSICLPV